MRYTQLLFSSSSHFLISAYFTDKGKRQLSYELERGIDRNTFKSITKLCSNVPNPHPRIPDNISKTSTININTPIKFYEYCHRNSNHPCSLNTIPIGTMQEYLGKRTDKWKYLWVNRTCHLCEGTRLISLERNTIASGVTVNPSTRYHHCQCGTVE